MVSDWQQTRRGGVSRDAAQAYLQTWIPMLYPATPHLAEKCGRFWVTTMLQIRLSDRSGPDEMILHPGPRGILATCHRPCKGVREHQRHTDGELSTVIIQTAQIWKDELANRAIQMHQESFDFKQGGNKFLQTQPYFRDEETKGEAAVWKMVVVGQKKRRGAYTPGESRKTI